MPAVIEGKSKISLNDHITNYVKDDREFMEGVKRGVADCRAGRKQLWSDVKRELHIK